MHKIVNGEKIQIVAEEENRIIDEWKKYDEKKKLKQMDERESILRKERIIQEMSQKLDISIEDINFVL